MTAAFFCRIYDFFIGRTFSAHTDIIHYRQIEQVVILRNTCNAFCAFGKRQGTDIHAAKFDYTVIYIPERCDKTGDSGFSASRRADKSVDRTLFYMQINAVKHLFIVIGKADVFQLDRVIARQLYGFLRSLHILAGKHLGYFTDNGAYLRYIIGIGESGHKRLHYAE